LGEAWQKLGNIEVSHQMALFSLGETAPSTGGMF